MSDACSEPCDAGRSGQPQPRCYARANDQLSNIASGSAGLYLLDDQAFKHELAVGTLQQAALHTVSSGQPEHQHWLGLPNAVSPVHCLQQHRD